MSNPYARQDGLVITYAGDDVIVYDPAMAQAHTFNHAANQLWLLCDGTRGVNELVDELGLGQELVVSTLDKLASLRLIGGYTPRVESPSRRNTLKKIGLVAIPVIASVSLPLAAAHASCGPVLLDYMDPCEPSKDCCMTRFVCANVFGGFYCYDRP